MAAHGVHDPRTAVRRGQVRIIDDTMVVWRSGNVTGSAPSGCTVALVEVPAVLEIRLLGPLEVRVDGSPLVVDTRKALAILALLATERRPFARDELAALLWPDADDESARGALRRTLSTLRSALGGRWLEIDRNTVILAAERITADLATAEDLARRPDADALAAAAALHRGAFLAGFSLRDAPAFDDWQAARATAVAVSLTALLDRLTAARLAAGDATGALEAARRRVDADPLDEAGQRRLIELLARTGDRAGAIRQYRACVAVLDAELGVPPLDETTALYERVRELHAAPDRAVERTATDAAQMAGPVPIVGRDADVAALTYALEAAGGAGSVAVIEGEAGIGKTRLLDEIAAAAARRGSRVFGARCYPGERGVAYGPLIALLRIAIALPDARPRLDRLSPAALHALAALVPEARPGSGRDPGADDALEPPAAKARLLDAIGDAIGVLTDGPAAGLAWLDDLHLADESTLEAVAWLGRRVATRRLLLLVTWRREDLDGSSAPAAGSLERTAAVHRRLGRLERDDVARLVARLRPDLGRAPADDLAGRAEGLPLYVVEALAAGGGAGEGSVVPPGVRALIEDRLSVLDGTAAQLLGAAAVIGRSFAFETVRTASGRSEDEAVDALERLVRRGFLREDAAGTGSSRWEFAHGSVRDVAYAALSLARRRLLHRRTAEAIGARSADALADGSVAERLDGPVAAAVAAHLAAAGLEEAAAFAFARAGEHAARLHANAEAIAHFEAALALGHPDPSGLHAGLGDLRTLRGEYGPAIRQYEAAASLIPSDLAALADLDHRLGRVHQRRGDSEAADGHFASALGALPAGSQRVNVLADRSLNARDAGRRDEAMQLAVEALHEAEECGVATALARASNVAGILATEAGDPAGGRIHLERSLALAEATADAAARIAALNNIGRALAAAGSYEDAIRLTRDALALCVSIGDRHREAALHNNLADLLHAVGRRDEAMEHLKTAVTRFSEVGEPGELEPGKWRMATW